MINKFTTDGSNLIKEIGYNTETHNMKVVWVSGAVYIYKSVPLTIFNSFITAPHNRLGEFFNENIKDRYLFEKVVLNKQEIPTKQPEKKAPEKREEPIQEEDIPEMIKVNLNNPEEVRKVCDLLNLPFESLLKIIGR